MKIYCEVPCITVSNSTKRDLIDLGFSENNIKIVPKGTNFEPLAELPEREEQPTFIYVGRLKRSKRVHDILRAFALVKRKLKDAKLWVVGEGEEDYKKKLRKFVERNNLKDVVFWGYVDAAKKLDLMRRSHAILVTSVREGWGLIVTEANAMGTPAMVYDVPGLRDSTVDGETGIVCGGNTPEDLAEEMETFCVDEDLRKRLGEGALMRARRLTWDRAAEAALAATEER